MGDESDEWEIGLGVTLTPEQAETLAVWARDMERYGWDDQEFAGINIVGVLDAAVKVVHVVRGLVDDLEVGKAVVIAAVTPSPLEGRAGQWIRVRRDLKTGELVSLCFDHTHPTRESARQCEEDAAPVLKPGDRVLLTNQTGGDEGIRIVGEPLTSGSDPEPDPDPFDGGRW